MVQLHFNYKDVFRACRLGFSAKKIWIQFLGFLVGAVGYILLGYVAYLAAGWSVEEIWVAHRLFFLPQALPWFGWVIWAIGLVWLVAVLLLTGAAVSKVTYEQLKGDEFYEVKAAFKFALKQGKAALASPLLLLAFIALLIVAGIILSLLGAIPYFGEIFVGLMAIPAFAVSIFIVYLLIVFGFNLMIGPAVVGTTKSDTFDTLFEVFSCVNEQNWRFLGYEALLGFMAKLVTLVLALASSWAVRIGGSVVRIFMRGKLDDVLRNALYYLRVNPPDWFPVWGNLSLEGFLNSLGLGQVLGPQSYIYRGWAMDISSFLLGIVFYGVILFVLAYLGATWFAGNTLIYTVLVKKKDDKNLLEVKEEEEEKKEEKAAPEVAEAPKEEQPKRRARGRPRKPPKA
jgi:hypothetical protein